MPNRPNALTKRNSRATNRLHLTPQICPHICGHSEVTTEQHSCENLNNNLNFACVIAGLLQQRKQPEVLRTCIPLYKLGFCRESAKCILQYDKNNYCIINIEYLRTSHLLRSAVRHFAVHLSGGRVVRVDVSPTRDELPSDVVLQNQGL